MTQSLIAERIRRTTSFAIRGQIVSTNGLCATVAGFPVPVGSICEVKTSGGELIDAEVVRFHQNDTLIMPYAEMRGIGRGCQVELKRSVPVTCVGEEIIGRVINAHGRVIDDKPQPQLNEIVDWNESTPTPMSRPRIEQPLSLIHI